MKKWKPTDCPIAWLIIQISWLLILYVHLFEKTLPATLMSGQLDVQKRKASGFQNTPLTSSSCVSFLLHDALLS